MVEKRVAPEYINWKMWQERGLAFKRPLNYGTNYINQTSFVLADKSTLCPTVKLFCKVFT
jgi:hypothetical protein